MGNCNPGKVLQKILKIIAGIINYTVSFISSLMCMGISIPIFIDDKNKAFDEASYVFNALGCIFWLGSLIISLYFGIHDHLNLILIILLLSSCILTVSLQYNKKSYGKDAYQFTLSMVTPIILCCKLGTTSYFMLDYILNNNNNIKDDEYISGFNDYTRSVYFKYIFITTVVELVLLAIVTYIPHMIKEFFYVSLWATEFYDLVSHFIVCIAFAIVLNNDATNNITSIWDDKILKLYFILFLGQLFCWATPMYITLSNKKFYAIHIALIDFIFDTGNLYNSFSKRTYIGNPWITGDLILKIIILLRSVIWVPINACVDDIKNTEPYNVLKTDDDINEIV